MARQFPHRNHTDRMIAYGDIGSVPFAGHGPVSLLRRNVRNLLSSLHRRGVLSQVDSGQKAKFATKHPFTLEFAVVRTAGSQAWRQKGPWNNARNRHSRSVSRPRQWGPLHLCCGRAEISRNFLAGSGPKEARTGWRMVSVKK